MPLEARALHEYNAQNTFQALILLEQVASRAHARAATSAGSISALRRGLDLARRELFRGELDDPMRAVLIFAASSARRSPAPASSPTPRACSARPSTWPARAARIARACSARSRRSAHRERHREAQRYLLEALELARPPAPTSSPLAART